MKKYTQQPVSISRVITASPKAAHQAPLPDILQSYGEKRAQAGIIEAEKERKDVPQQEVIQCTRVQTLKKIRLHLKKESSEEEERSPKVMIPAGELIEIDANVRWNREGTPMIRAVFEKWEGYVKDLAENYWSIRPLLQKQISELCNAFGIDKAVLQQPVNILGAEGKGTIEEYLIEQLKNLSKHEDAELDASLRNSIIIQGMARGLAQKLGDLNAENRIARRLVHEQKGLESKEGFKYVDSLARSNPVVKYLHRELNLNDTLVLIGIRARRVGMDNGKMLDIMVEKALNELVSIQPEMMADSLGRRYPIDNSFGQYNKSFITSHIKDRDWTAFAGSKIQKLRDRLAHDPPGEFTSTQDVAIRRAQSHDRKMREKATDDLVANKMAELIDTKFPQPDKAQESASEAPKTEASPKLSREQIGEKIEAMLQLLEKADITIARHSGSLIEKDLKGKSLLSGNLTKYKSLEAVKTDGPASDSKIEKGISFIPLLEKPEGDRDEYYPPFRTRKDHIHGGKTWKKRQQIPIFGALDYCDEDNHGFLKDGYKKGYYGDVVFVLNKEKIKNKVIYTNKAKGRSYTDLRMFLYDMILQDTKNINGDKQTDIDILTDLYMIIENQHRTTLYVMKHLEVQIYEDVLFHPEYIKEIIFAGSVRPEDREIIKRELDGKAASVGGGTWVYKEYTYGSEKLLNTKTIPKDSKICSSCLSFGKDNISDFVKECVKMNVVSPDQSEDFTQACEERYKSSSVFQVSKDKRQFPEVKKTDASAVTTDPVEPVHTTGSAAMAPVVAGVPGHPAMAPGPLIDQDGGIRREATKTFIEAYRQDLSTPNVYLSAREGSVIADFMGISIDVYEARQPEGYKIQPNPGGGDCLIHALYQAQKYERQDPLIEGASLEEIQKARSQLSRGALSDEDVIALCGAAVAAAINGLPEPGLGPQMQALIAQARGEYSRMERLVSKAVKKPDTTGASSSGKSKAMSALPPEAPVFNVVMGSTGRKLQNIALLHQGDHWMMIYKSDVLPKSE